MSDGFDRWGRNKRSYSRFAYEELDEDEDEDEDDCGYGGYGGRGGHTMTEVRSWQVAVCSKAPCVML